MFTKLKQAFERMKAAIWCFVTCDHLAESIREHTETLRAHTEASNALMLAIREHSASLLTKISTVDAIAESARYLAASERRGLQRSGHPSDF